MTGREPMTRILAPLVVLLMLTPMAAAEVFVLSGGGRLTGDLLNPNQSPRKQYVIQTDAAKVTLDAARVKKVLRPRAGEAEYERIAPTYPDTAAAQWELAQWCRDHKLTVQRHAHLRRVIELDPNHAEARRALGYHRVDGQWITYDEIMAKRGYVKHNGKWLLPQELQIADDKKRLEAAQQDWFHKLKVWRGWLGTDRDQQARLSIVAIADPDAVRALATGLLHDEKNPQTRLLFVEALAKIDASEAARALAIAAVYDEVEEVRLTCLDHLQTKPRPDVVTYFIGKLRDRKSGNEIINAAAVGLGRMKDPSAIGPLIEALVTTHKFKIVQPGGDGAMGASFGKGPNSGGTGLSMGNGPRFIYRNIPNQAVLDALVALTGRNFNFDKEAWKSWYAAQKKSPDRIDARRDGK
jgi:hypothetical protein